MKTIRSDLALHRILDALEADLLAASAAEIEAVVAETGMSARALLGDRGPVFGFMKAASPLEGEVMAQSSRRDREGGDSAPHPDLRSDLPLKGGGA
jgi:hypothetical protein